MDKIIVISTAYDYVLPNEIQDKYDTDNIIIIKPKTIFAKSDTFRFEKQFCNRMYNEGYEIGMNLETIK